MATPRTTRSQRLLDTLAPFDQVLVVAHDNPDPDAIATGWAVLCLLREKLSCQVQLLAGGQILRAENRQMVQLLQPPLELVREAAYPPAPRWCWSIAVTPARIISSAPNPCRRWR